MIRSQEPELCYIDRSACPQGSYHRLSPGGEERVHETVKAPRCRRTPSFGGKVYGRVKSLLREAILSLRINEGTRVYLDRSRNMIVLVV